jgi:hypothetical protein
MPLMTATEFRSNVSDPFGDYEPSKMDLILEEIRDADEELWGVVIESLLEEHKLISNPKIHDAFEKMGFDVHVDSVRRYRNKLKKWHSAMIAVQAEES